MKELRIEDCRLGIGKRFCHRALIAFFLFTVVLAGSQICRSESLASKNKRGNRLFEQGKYEDAEKAYLSAQADNPGKPEVLYNLGNSLIKQKKYREGVQALGQSIKEGDKRIKEKGWYNTGNSLFSAGDYKDSADAFIQALRLDPGDRDAKHNLELALMKLEKQKQETSDKNQKQQDSKGSNTDKSPSGKQTQPQKSNQDKSSSGNQKENDRAKPQPSQSIQREGSISKDQALQLLDAVKNQELKEQRKLLETRAAQKSNSRDW